MANYTVGMK